MAIEQVRVGSQEPIDIHDVRIKGIDNEPIAESENVVSSGGLFTYLADNYGYYVDNPEFVRVCVDAEQKILYGVKSDGSFYFGEGCPQQVKEYIEEKLAELSLDEYEDIVRFLDNLIFGDKTLSELLSEQNERINDIDYRNVNKHDVRSHVVVKIEATDGWQQIDRVSADPYDESDTYQIDEICNVDIDSAHSYKSLVKQKGNYPAKEVEYIVYDDHLTLQEALDLIPADVKAKFRPGQVLVYTNEEGNLERMELQENNEWVEYFNNKVDKVEGKSLIDRDYADSVQYISNPEYVEVHTDSEDKILYAVKQDGNFYFGAGVPSQIEERLNDLENTIETYVDDSVSEFDTKIENESSRAIEAENNINERLNRLNIAIDPDRGVLRICGKMFKLIDYVGEADFDEDIDYTVFVEATTTLENPEWQQAITDSEDRLLYGKKQDSGEEYWPQDELEGYTMTVDGVTASVNSIIRNIK